MTFDNFYKTDNKKDAENLLLQLLEDKKNIIEKTSQVDKSISDIYHYIEFTNCNAYQGYKIYKLLQEFLKIRRIVKNQFHDIDHKIAYINSLISVLDEYDKKLDKQRKKEEDLTYTPKILLDINKLLK